MMTPYPQLQKQSIVSWLENIEPRSPESSEPTAKRACRRHSPTLTPREEVTALNTPPETDDSMMASDHPMTPVIRGARKRTSEEAGDEQGLDDQGRPSTARTPTMS